MVPSVWQGILALVLVTGWGCASPATQVLVWADVAEGSALRGRASAVRVEVRGEDGEIVLSETRRLSGEPPLQALPLSVSVVPIDGDASRVFRVEISLLEGPSAAPTIIATQVAESSFVPNALREIHLSFDDACADVVCGEGRTCIAGVCERACFSPAPPDTEARSMPTSCTCRCSCAGDVCRDGLCVPLHPVTAVTTGHEHTCAIDDRGQLFCWGHGSDGELGVGDMLSYDRPTAVTLGGAVRAVAAGARHTCAALEDGSAWCWGDGRHGELGAGAAGPSGVPVRLVDLAGVPPDRVVALGAGGIFMGTPENRHSCAVLASGLVWCWGNNDFGQLGRGTMTMSVEGEPPQPTAFDATWDLLVEVELGAFHTCARHSAGRLFCWGNDHDWQLGFVDQVDRALPSSLTEGNTMLNAVADVAAGTWHTCAVTPASELFCWGEGGGYRTGIPRDDPFMTDVTEPTRVLDGRRFRAVECGHRHSCAIDERGTLVCFGTSNDGELGVRAVAGTATSAPVEVADEAWSSVALGTSYTCGIREGGALYCWGRNTEGQLGIGGNVAAAVPTRVCMP